MNNWVKLIELECAKKGFMKNANELISGLEDGIKSREELIENIKKYRDMFDT